MRALFAVAALLVAVACRTNAPAPRAPERPNLVVFLVDDWGWQDLSVPFAAQRTPFNDFYRTPALQQFAADSVSFLDAHACAVCTPSRISLLTGQNAARHHVTNWILDGETSGQSAQLAPPRWQREGLQPGAQPTLPAILRAAGYRTIHVGKAHWGAVGTPGADPCNLGFDVNIAGHAAGAPGSYQGEDRYGEGIAGKEVWAVPGLESYKGTATHLTDALTREACREVQQAVAAGQPFFLHLAHYAVHTPLQPHRPHADHYATAPVAPSERDYASMVEGVDRSLGALRQQLVDLGVAERTLIVVYSDNGGLSHVARGANIRGTGRETHNWPLREGKGSAYEGGTRVPAMVGWAAADPAAAAQVRLPIARGARCAQPLMIEDLFPTLLHIAECSAPAFAPIDGQDFTACLGDPGRSERSAPLFWHFPNVWTPEPEGSRSGYRPHSAIRVGTWKAIYFYDDERWQLYDLARDLGEQRDLAAEAPELLTNLAARLSAYLHAVGAPWPLDRATGKERELRVPGVARG